MTTPCLAPDPNPRAPRFEMPAGATDCHSHVIAAPDQYPYVDERSYTPPPAPLEAYKALHKALGIERAVIVQPSVHGTDNRVTIEAIAGYGPNCRGIGVVEDTISERELAELHDGGIRGLRLNVLFGGGVGMHAMRPLADKIKDMGWHLQLLLDARDLVDLEDTIRQLPVPTVVDHMGHMHVSHGMDHPGYQALLRLVGNGHTWIKLSGNYRISSQVPEFKDAIPFAQALINAAPEHMVWGTDWPHPALTEFMPNDGDLLDALDDYAPDATLKQKILVDNPAQLYGF